MFVVLGFDFALTDFSLDKENGGGRAFGLFGTLLRTLSDRFGFFVVLVGGCALLVDGFFGGGILTFLGSACGADSSRFLLTRVVHFKIFPGSE